MKNIFKTVAFLFVLGGMCVASCTDVESIDINEKSVADQNPEAYAKYLSNLTAYKAADHKIVYAFFDNSEKEPYSPVQHITNLPDSIDIVVMTTPELAEFELSDIESIHEKGTKVYLFVSYDDIKAAYDDMEEPSQTFSAYLQSQLTTQISYAGDYDGLVAEFSGQDYTFLSGDDLSDYTSVQNVFLSAVTSWKSSNSSKGLALLGLPQNLSDKTILSSCDHIILDSESAASAAELDLLVAKASVSGVPTDRFVMTASTVSLSSSDTDTGYWGDTRALSEVAYWVTNEEDYTKAGLAIYNVQNDYYSTTGDFTYVRQAIDIMNPSPVK